MDEAQRAKLAGRLMTMGGTIEGYAERDRTDDGSEIVPVPGSALWDWTNEATLLTYELWPEAFPCRPDVASSHSVMVMTRDEYDALRAVADALAAVRAERDALVEHLAAGERVANAAREYLACLQRGRGGGPCPDEHEMLCEYLGEYDAAHDGSET